MKKTKVILLINLFFVFGLSAQSLDLSVHLNFASDDFFKSGTGIEMAYNIELNNRFQLQPTLAFNSLKNNTSFTSPDGVVSDTKITDGFLSVGTAIFYSLLSNEKQKLLIGPSLNLIFFPKIKSLGLFADPVTTLTPNEFRFYTGLNTTFRQMLNDKFGFKTYLEFGYHTKSNLKEGTDYPQNYANRTYQDFTNLKVGLGIFYSIN